MNNNKKDSAEALYELFKTFGIAHLSIEDIQSLSERKLDKESMCRAVLHISECHQCCMLAPKLTSQQIEDALRDTPYGDKGMIQQTIDYYFETLNEKE